MIAVIYALVYLLAGVSVPGYPTEMMRISVVVDNDRSVPWKCRAKSILLAFWAICNPNVLVTAIITSATTGQQAAKISLPFSQMIK